MAEYPSELNIAVIKEDVREALRRLWGTRVSLSENCPLSVAAERIYGWKVASTASEIFLLNEDGVCSVSYQSAVDVGSPEYAGSFTAAFDSVMPYTTGKSPAAQEMIDTIIRHFTFPLEFNYVRGK